MRKLAVLCIGLLGLTLLVGCGGDNDRARPGGPPDRASSYASMEPAPAAPPLSEHGPGRGDNGPARKDNVGGETVTARMEVVSGSVEMTAGEPVETAGKVADRVREAGGRVDSRTEQPGTDDTDPSATLTVRVPADKTDAFIDGLGGLGRVTRVHTNRDDVTMQWEDLDARIKALQASVDRLRGLIAGATNTADLINAEQALSSRQGELDSLTAQKRHLDDEVALSTLTVDITTATTKAEEDRADNFWEGIVAGWNSLVDWLKDAVVFTGKALPWLGFLVVLGAVVWAIVRRVSRRRRGGARTESPVGVASGSGEGAQQVTGSGGAATGAKSAGDGPGGHQAEQP
ncbi:uncharacterized protein DUF4349 [Nocardia tenerifensis]|uniref:Uncharacterized protein DUF4349 n=1 Tax=Nocardia tenerifensis TaxID=228006 RepID=A0A318KH74_9NOCA|nr:DUF4349 domain-containing protein [Nocardia tenerifensis]PXX66473.1 uncharacterized protein DUF4349 [Nocardia tenerifensis]